MRGYHHPVDAYPRAALERGDPSQRLRDCGLGLRIGAQPIEIARDVVVAVHRQRQHRRALREQRRDPPVDQPAVEWDRCKPHVIAVLYGVCDQFAVVDEPVRRPVEVRVIDHERRAQRRQLPALAPENLCEQVHQWEQSHEAAGSQMLAQRLTVVQPGEWIRTCAR